MALTAPRRSQNLIDGLLLPGQYATKAGKVFYKGAHVGLDSGGYLVPMANTPGLRSVGLVDTGHNASVSTVGQNDGDTILKTQAGVWAMVNSGTDPVGQTELRKLVYAADDQTIAKTDGGANLPIAGELVQIEGSAYFVAIGFFFGGGQAVAGVAEGGSVPGPSNLVTVGALGLTRTTRITVDGTKAFTLADGTEVGQRKTIRQTAATNTPNGTVTPAHASGFTSLTAWDAVGDQAELEWNGTAWEVVFSNGVTLS